MAEETPQQASAAPAGGDEAMPEAKPSKGITAYLPLIVAIVLMPVLAVGTVKLKGMFGAKAGASGKAKAVAPAEAEHAGEESASDSAEEGEGGGVSTKPKGWNKKLAVPLTRMPITFKKAAVADKDKPADHDKFVVLDLKGDPKDIADAEKIVVNIARTGGTRFAAVRVWMMSDTDDFLVKLNANRERLIDITSGVVSSKTLEEIETLGFRNLLRAELLAAFNRALGGNLVREIIIDGPIIQ